MSTPTITPEEFNTFKDDYIKKVMSNAFHAVCDANAWEWLADFNDTSFMFSKDPMVAKIDNNMVKLGFNDHSGASFGWTMREMEYLAKNEKDKFLNRYR